MAETLDDAEIDRLVAQFDDAVAKLDRTSGFAKVTAQAPVIDLGHRLLSLPDGPSLVYDRIEQIESAGVFAGTDWDHPETLQPSLAAGTLEHGERSSAALELLSELRLLALARGDGFHLNISSETAEHFLAQVLALELDQLFGPGTEADRQAGSHGMARRNVLAFIADHIGYGNVLDGVVAEIERILGQRPILVDDVKIMITRVASYLEQPDTSSGSALGVTRLVSALYGPAANCRDDPGIDVYAERLTSVDESGLIQEARELALAMHTTGLVSPYHVVFLHHINSERDDLIGHVLGLSPTGADALSCYTPLVQRLIDVAITHDTPQTVYSLALMLERGVLFNPAVSPSLWGQIGLEPSDHTREILAGFAGGRQPASTLLLAGAIDILGQPLGIGQGNNPTCQAARAISMWALAAPDYLLRVVTRAARDDEIGLFFEGQRISSAEVADGSFSAPLLDVDPVSMVLVPHLDRIYMEMGRRCIGRDGDPHAWINREMHGWWVGRDTALAVDIPTGQLVDIDTFVRRFYALYHPLHNDNRPVIHPHPTGVAITDSLGRFIGWHAISILRVGLDPSGVMRVFFFNPNNDSGQDWGDGVVVSTESNGERFGESSLPIAEFVSRLYLYHYDPCDVGDVTAVPTDEVRRVESMARATWAADR